MSRLEDLIQSLCPDGVDFIPLEEVLDYSQPTPYIVKSTLYDDSFDTPVLTAGASFILGYTDEKKGIYCASYDKPVIIFDDFTTSFHWVDFNFKVKSSAMKILTELEQKPVVLRYVFYAMQCITYQPSQHARQWIQTYSKIRIPLPPLPVQAEIVRILDKFSGVVTELEAEQAARSRQYEHYRNKLLTFVVDDIDLLNVGDVCETVTDFVAAGSFADLRTMVVYNPQPDYAQLVRTTDLKSNFRKSDFVYVPESAFKYLWRVNLDEESIILPNVGNCGEVYFVLPENLPHQHNVLGPNAILIRSRKVNNKFLSYLFLTHEFQTQLMKITSPAGQTKFNKTDLKRLVIPIPSREVQEEIVSILDHFDTLVNDLKSGLPAEITLRRKQYEYYRDKLLTFPAKQPPL